MLAGRAHLQRGDDVAQRGAHCLDLLACCRAMQMVGQPRQRLAIRQQGCGMEAWGWQHALANYAEDEQPSPQPDLKK